ncbi:hypothetical protein CMO91_05625 [Candidatus Woesearchaeota archaeon]|jgi:hypothetical protein|nr:hypothetical protein [Candidatus Woesearchaeota archaeon]|tara:strand:- start:712 stop:996 length:285 start_codon:yes stop_codon:yes gene_type:complete
MQPKICKNLITCSLGLMFQKPKPLLMAFKKDKHVPIHTWFMRGTIDVYWLDENKKIVERATLPPWKYYKPKVKARYVLELPEGAALPGWTKKAS